MLQAGAEFLWDAFWELTTDRPLGFGGEGCISGSAIRAFAAEHGFCGDQGTWFVAVMREMDAEYLGVRRAERQTVVDEVPVTDHQGLRGLLRRLAKPVKIAA